MRRKIMEFIYNADTFEIVVCSGCVVMLLTLLEIVMIMVLTWFA